MDRGAWWATVHEVAKSWIQLSAHTLTRDNSLPPSKGFGRVWRHQESQRCPLVLWPGLRMLRQELLEAETQALMSFFVSVLSLFLLYSAPLER